MAWMKSEKSKERGENNSMEIKSWKCWIDMLSEGKFSLFV